MKMKLNFYDWCIKNDRQDLLSRWDYELNKCNPEDIRYGSGKNMYFKCLCHPEHLSESHRISHITNSKIEAFCKQCNSFYQWCVDNNKYEFINSWDYELNIDDIHYVPHCSGKKYYFKVINGLPSIKYCLSEITGPKKRSPIKKFYNSLGYWLISNYGEDAIQKYWSEKNNLTPWEYDKGSGKQVWFKCNIKDYHEDYLAPICSFTSGSRCPWCVGKKVHPLDSFAQYNIDKFGEDFLEKYWCEDNTINPWEIRPFANNIFVHIQCQHKEYHKYWVEAADYSVGIDCPFCNKKRVHINDSFGTLFPDMVDLWSEKNKRSPFEYRVFSHEMVWFKCENHKHEDYLRRIADVSNKGFKHCPFCVQERKESFLQEKVRLFLESTPYLILHEYQCSIIPINPQTKHKLPFDNEVCDINGTNLIIETHGVQHYELAGWHITQSKHSNTTPEKEFKYQQWKDNFKKNYAISQGYEYLEIPYWTIDDGTYKNLISNKIKEMERTIL